MQELIEMFQEYEERIEKGNMTDELYRIVKEQVEQKWSGLKYSVEDVSRLILAREFIKIADSSLINYFFNECKIQLTHKDKKRGKKAIFSRFKRRFHQKHVRQTLDEFLEVMAREPAKELMENPIEETVVELIDKHKFDYVYWVINFYMKNECLKMMIEKESPYEKLSYYVRAYLFYHFEEFENVIERPQLLEQKEKEKKKMLQDENKSLRRKIHRTQKKKFDLESSVKELKKEKKKLDQDLNDLYESALREIEVLKKMKAELENDFQKEREFYYMTIEQLLKQLNPEEKILSEVKEQERLNLKGKKLCVIGGEKEKGYQTTIEKYNGKLRFVSVNDFNKIEGAVSECDVIFFLTGVSGHQHFFRAYETSKKYEKEFVFINSLGKTSFERELKNYIKKQKQIV